MRTLGLLLLATVAAASSLVVSAAPAAACSCAQATVADHVARAAVVLVGTAEDRQDPPLRPVMGSGDPAVHTFAVDAVYVGEAPAVAHVRSAASGASCGLEGIELGERYVVFAGQGGDGLWASLCGGTAPAGAGLLAEVEAAAGAPRSPDPAAAAGDPPPAVTAGLAGPTALAAAVLLSLVTGLLWLRQLRG